MRRLGGLECWSLTVYRVVATRLRFQGQFNNEVEWMEIGLHGSRFSQTTLQPRWG